jgi:transcriptional regulator with XRE-family HTH domain
MWRSAAKNRCPTHPGALLRDDIIPATGRTKAEIAGLLGISRQHLYDIPQERKPVSPTIAVRLGYCKRNNLGHNYRESPTLRVCLKRMRLGERTMKRASGLSVFDRHNLELLVSWYSERRTFREELFHEMDN